MCCAGLVTVVAGTFLPWFRSGGVLRNSYETIALADHFALFGDAALAVVFRSWIAVPLATTACLALYALRLFRTAATLSAVLAIVVGTVALTLAVESGGTGGPIGLASAGPWTSTAGAITALIGAVGAAIATRGRNRSTDTPRNR
ncbi:hypothetical protein CFN78_15460 [Amycolatopsis antarctica]|uniref:Uncharacterized protein n=2 Tax=Amycolatopsis antarctica TaxID=1854586 RepID=A0A263D4W9_9PSEU|nr:hypothetical protein CFN78_15460 [Amycolatopsis antarctica]